MAKEKIEVEITGSSAGLQNSVDTVNKKITTLGSSGKKTASELDNALKKTGNSIKNSLNKGTNASNALSVAMKKAKASIVSLGSKGKQSVDKLTGSINKAKSALDKLDVSDVLGGGAVFAGAIAAATALYERINMAQQAMSKLQAMTGADDVKMQGLMENVGNVYASGAGQDWLDVGNAVGVSAQITGLDGSALEDVAKSALIVRDSFEIDINESIRAADSLIKQFGINGNEAYTLMAQAAQNGADKNGDLADTMNEYATQFKQLGFSAEEFTGILITGAQSGAWSIDKVGDAMKEFNIRVKDGSKTTNESFAALGLDADDMAQRFAIGGDSAKQAFNDTIAALKAMKDPVAQDAAGVGLFGTMWEDLGAKGVLALSDISDKADMTADTLSKMQIANISTLGGIFEFIGRQIEVGLVMPLIQEAMPLLKEFAGFLVDFFSSIKENGLAQTLKDMIPPELQITLGAIAGIIGGVLIVSIAGLISVVAPLATAFAGVVTAAAPVIAIGAAIGASVAVAVASLEEMADSFDVFSLLGDTVSNTMDDIFSAFSDTFSSIIDSASSFTEAFIDLISSISPVIAVIATVFATTFELIGNILSTFLRVAGDVISGAIDVLTGIITFLTGVFTLDWQTAWSGIEQIFAGIFNTIKNIAGDVLGGILDMVNTVIGKVNTLTGLSLPSIGSGKPAQNAKGGIYSQGAFLTYFAEDSAEAAIPIDGSQRAENLWLKTGQMLGMFRKQNAEGMSISPLVSGNSVADDITTTAKAEIVMKTDKALSDIGKLKQKISELQSQGKDVSENLYTGIKDKEESLIQDINKGFDEIQKNAFELNKDFLDFKIQSNFSHLKGTEKLQAQMVLDTTDAFDKLDAYKNKFIDSTKEAQSLVEAAQKAGNQQALDRANAVLEERKADEIAAEKYIAKERMNILNDFYDAQLNAYKNCKDIQAELDEAYDTLNLERLKEILTTENAVRLNNMQAQQEMMNTYQEVFLAANMTNAQLISDLYGSVYDSLGENINSLIMGTVSWGEAIRNLGTSLIQTVVNFYAQKLAGMLTASLMGESMEKASAAKSTAIAAQQAAAWATAALYKEMVMPGTSAIALGSLAASSVGASALSTAASVPALASGGITKGATLAMIGEGKYQEAVMPLNRSYFEKAGLISDGGNTTYSINISAVDAKSVEKLFKKNGKNLVKGLSNHSFKSTGRGQVS